MLFSFFLILFSYAIQGKFITSLENSTLNCTWKPISHSSLRDSCDISFRVQFNAEFPRQVINFPIIYICYLPAGRSVLRKTVPEVLTYPRPRAQFSPIRTDLGRQINCLLFSSVEYFVISFCVEFSLQPFSNLVYACVWHLGNRKSNQRYTHWRKLINCLFLRSLFTFYVLCSEKKKNCRKRRESWKISSGPYAGSGMENPKKLEPFYRLLGELFCHIFLAPG